jgi:biopolymer transport protein ExbD
MTRISVFLLLTALFSACAQQNYVVQIPANDTLALSYDDYNYHDVTLKNKSLKTIEVGVQSTDVEEVLRSFGLGMKGKATVMVEKDNQLLLRNATDVIATVKIQVEEGEAPKKQSKADYVNFTLRNNSPKAIPLIIPTVMNPNLSPFSNSGVGLKIGQEILFKKNGKRYVLLTVDERIEEGAVVEVSSLLRQRRKELGL